MSESVLPSTCRRSVALALAGVLFLAPPLSIAARALHGAPSLSGLATVVDGDTIDIDGVRVRLEGIDAPESAQTCGRKWVGWWNCGKAAGKALDSLVDGRRTDCQSRGHDKYGRTLGVCFVDGRDINAEMVRSGLAWAFVKYSSSYVAAESEARAAHAGIWQGNAEPAWVFREKRWQTAATAEAEAPNGCTIKGNVTANGRIYHMPWGEWYSKVKVEPLNGERWFCSEDEARAAGWRAALAR